MPFAAITVKESKKIKATHLLEGTDSGKKKRVNDWIWKMQYFDRKYLKFGLRNFASGIIKKREITEK